VGLSKVALRGKAGQRRGHDPWSFLFRCSLAPFPPGPPAALYNEIQMLHFSALPHFIDWHWLWFTVASFLAGVLNAVAGGGSFLSFPAMLSMKILPVQANATNTVALWPGQLTSIAAYRQDIRKNLRFVWPMGMAGLIGGTAGALVLLNTPQMTFLHLVPWLLLISASIFAFSGPVSRWFVRISLSRRQNKLDTIPHPPRRMPMFLATMAVCFYIGYFGAGAGFLLITVLSLFGFQDLHEINALKVVSTTLANGIAVIIFAVSNKVVWPYCMVAMVVCAIGGYSSARMARRVPQPVLRGLVIFIGFSMAAWFFWRQ
jgi:uncharacterized membrane protein YfcA